MAAIDPREKIEEVMDNSPVALVLTLFGYASAYVGICGGFYLLYKLVSHN